MARTTDERALVWPHQLMHERCQANCQSFSEKLVEAVNKTNGSVILYFFGVHLLPQQDHIRLIDKVEAAEIKRPKCAERCHDVMFDDRPRRLVEQACETNWPRGFLHWQSTNDGPNFIFGEVMINPYKTDGPDRAPVLRSYPRFHQNDQK
jgi:hypothetical protein